MTDLNKGYVFLNERPLGDDERAVFCVLGTAGGGTTMTARLLEAAGIFMGARMAFNAEDPQFARLLKEISPDQAAFRELVARRSAARPRWGFKAPFRFHRTLLSEIENVRYVTIFRDVLAAGVRTMMSGGARPVPAMSGINARQKELLAFMAVTNRPTLVLSYEKALTAPEEIARAVLAFTGTAETDDLVAQMKTIVQPNEPTYVAGQVALAAQRRR